LIDLLEQSEEENQMWKSKFEAAADILGTPTKFDYIRGNEMAAIRVENKMKMEDIKEMHSFPKDFMDAFAWDPNWDESNCVRPNKSYNEFRIGKPFKATCTLEVRYVLLYILYDIVCFV
jgi:3-methyladenine DNA glycosylase/8-oxoguanine DNA glycosylase